MQDIEFLPEPLELPIDYLQFLFLPSFHHITDQPGLLHLLAEFFHIVKGLNIGFRPISRYFLLAAFPPKTLSTRKRRRFFLI